MANNLTRKLLCVVAMLLGMAGTALAGPSGARGASAVSHATVNEPADLVLTHGVIYTVDRARPEVQAVAVRDGRILAVGSNAEIR